MSLLVAGNAVLDIVAPDAELPTGGARDGWGANVRLLTSPFQAVVGGGGAAAAWVAARSGAVTVLNANLADDTFGAIIVAELERAGVAVMPPTATASAVHVIAVSPAGERRSLYFPGEAVPWQRCSTFAGPGDDAGVDWLLAMGSASTTGDDAALLATTFEGATRAGTRVAFDPGPWLAARTDAASRQAIISRVDCLLGTTEELGEWAPAGAASPPIERLAAAGVGMVVEKRGRDGVAFLSADGARDTVRVKPIAGSNSTGAGDAFAGRLMAGLVMGEPLAPAVAAAARLATRAVASGRGATGAFGRPDPGPA